MYSDRWSPGLRQGDVVGQIFFPSLGAEIQTIGTTRSLTAIEGGTVSRIAVPGEQRYVAIVSHDCEFNEGKRNRFLVARIEDVPRYLSDEQRSALRASNDVEARAEAKEDVAGVDSFLLDPLPGVFDDEQIIVFTTITPLPMKLKAELMAAKQAELQQATRVLLRTKLAWFFGREADDVDDERKFDRPLRDDSAEPEGESTG